MNAIHWGEVRVHYTNPRSEMLSYCMKAFFIFSGTLNFSIDDKPLNLETKAVSTFDSISSEFERAKYIYWEKLSKNQNKMEEGAKVLSSFPQFLLFIQNAFARCTSDN